MEIEFTTKIFREGKAFVAYAQELDISSCGRTKEKAFANLKEAVRLFMEEAERMGTLETILAEAGYKKTKATLQVPEPVSVRRVSLPVPLTHVKV
jgi:predicted RNase H-like HicB family nuclease